MPFHRLLELGLVRLLQLTERGVQRIELEEIAVPSDRRTRPAVAGALPVVGALARACRKRPAAFGQAGCARAGCRTAPSAPRSAWVPSDRAHLDRPRSAPGCGCPRALRSSSGAAQGPRPRRCGGGGFRPGRRMRSRSASSIAPRYGEEQRCGMPRAWTNSAFSALSLRDGGASERRQAPCPDCMAGATSSRGD